MLGFVKPKSSDILKGRGSRTLEHEGNKQFRQLIEKYKIDYVITTNKTKFCKYIYDMITKDKSVRFLKETAKNFWIEIDEKEALKKIAQALREGAPELRSSLENNDTIQNDKAIGSKKEDESVETFEFDMDFQEKSINTAVLDDIKSTMSNFSDLSLYKTRQGSFKSKKSERGKLLPKSRLDSAKSNISNISDMSWSRKDSAKSVISNISDTSWSKNEPSRDVVDSTIDDGTHEMEIDLDKFVHRTLDALFPRGDSDSDTNYNDSSSSTSIYGNAYSISFSIKENDR